MAKYLVEASYTEAGLKGIVKSGGTARKKALQQLAKSLGGKLESFYFGFGDSDVYVVLDLPGNVEAAATALVVNASGAVKAKTTVLLTPEDVDAAAKTTVDYRPPK